MTYFDFFCSVSCQPFKNPSFLHLEQFKISHKANISMVNIHYLTKSNIRLFAADQTAVNRPACLCNLQVYMFLKPKVKQFQDTTVSDCLKLTTYVYLVFDANN